MSKVFDKEGREVIKSPYIVDVDFVDYTAKIREMVESGLVARYERNAMYDDTEAKLEEELEVFPYSDVGDIAVRLPSEDELKEKFTKNVKTEEFKEQEKPKEQEKSKEDNK